MTTVSTKWEYRGVDLSTYAYYVRALGAPEQVPGRRGEDIVVPGKTGRVHVEKFMDARHLPLAMQVNGRDPATGGDLGGSQLWQNLDALKALFAQDGLGTLRHYHAAGTSRWAMAEVVSTTVFEPGGPWHYDFVVELVLPDPLWYDEALTTVGPTNVDAGTVTIPVVNEGTWKNEAAEIELVGPAVDPKFSLGDCWVQWTGTIEAGGTLLVDCADFSATYNGTAETEHITHDGALIWLPIPVGSADMTLVCTNYAAGTTACTVTFREAYI